LSEIQNIALLSLGFTQFASLLLKFGELCGLMWSGGLSLRPPVTGRRERVLVLGAAGGVGSLAAQLAAQAGAQVVAVGGTASQGE
jgi:NADPH:quinone reductase-like Zn-dependent oxidoreductase